MEIYGGKDRICEIKTVAAPKSRRRIGCAPPGGGAPAPEDRGAPDPADDREQAGNRPAPGGAEEPASPPNRDRASWGVRRGPGRAARRHPDLRVGSSPNRASWGVRRGPGRAARGHPDLRVGSPATRASWGGSDGCPAPHLSFSGRCPAPHLSFSGRWNAAASVVFRQMERRCICRVPADARCAICRVPADAPRPIGRFPADAAAPHTTDARAQASCARAYLVVISLKRKRRMLRQPRSMRWGLKAKRQERFGWLLAFLPL